MSNLPTLALFAIFLFSAAVVLLSGRPLANTTATLSRRYGLGQALGGMLILAVVTDLPELAIIVSASIRGDLSLAVGNVLGGTAAQLMVLVALDRAHAGGPSLATRASSTALKVECLLVILLLSVVIAGPSLVAIGNLGPFTLPDLLTPLLWIAGLLWIAKLRPCNAGDGKQVLASNGDKQALLIFMISALVTFVGGVGLEVVGDALADRFHMGGVLFGATILAAATSLPELSTGWSSAKAGENELAVSDIMGGNACCPCC
jgi:cation:H+ antiporter